MTTTAICSPNLVHQTPLAVQRDIRRPERIAFVVNVCSFGSRPVQLDDLKSFAGSKLVIAVISNVVPPDIEARELLTDFVKRGAKFLRVEVSAIFEDATLAMIASFDQAQTFVLLQYPVRDHSESLQVSPCNQSCARVRFNQLPNRMDTVAHEGREFFTRDTKDAAFLLPWESVVENSG